MTDDGPTPEPSAPIAFGRRLAGSESFWNLFHEGMSLVEETANYLDGAGKSESRRLPRAATVSFGTESMRLTTRLMQLASWLLLQRAINDGSISVERAESERSKVKLGVLATTTDGPGWDHLPETLKRLILRSLRLQDRVAQLDVSLRDNLAGGKRDNPVARAIGRLQSAFEGRK